MVRGGLSSALALLTRVTELRAPVTSPCYHPLPTQGDCAIPTSIPAAAALIYGEEVGNSFSGGALALLHPIPSELAQPCLHHPKPSTLCPPLSVQQEGKAGRRMVMKNGHTSSLPANTESQRAVLPSLLGAAAGDSSLFWGSSKTSVL